LDDLVSIIDSVFPWSAEGQRPLQMRWRKKASKILHALHQVFRQWSQVPNW